MNVGPNVGTRTLEECEHVVNLSLLQTGGAFKEIRDRKLRNKPQSSRFGDGSETSRQVCK
jgi:hypothetical protein